MLSLVLDRCPGKGSKAEGVRPPSLKNVWVSEGPQMQFGAIFWENLKENYRKFLEFFTQETNKEF